MLAISLHSMDSQTSEMCLALEKNLGHILLFLRDTSIKENVMLMNFNICFRDEE